jgi:hypothetical protein
MSAARPLPEAGLEILIQPGGTVSSGNANLKVSSGSIYFNNSATFPVNIVFTNALTNISNLQPRANSASEGATTVTVNYVVVNANTKLQTGGPYSVQFGIGPLPIEIENVTSDPDPTTVPEGGQIAFSADAEYGISWTLNGQSANVWSPQPSTIAEGQNSAQTALPGANGNSLTYTLSDRMGIRGGGTVKIGT